jgi:hypothetical protein
LLGGSGEGFFVPNNVIKEKIVLENKEKIARQQTTAPALNFKDRLEIKDFQNDMHIDLPGEMDKFLNVDDMQMAKQMSDPYGGQQADGQQGRVSKEINVKHIQIITKEPREQSPVTSINSSPSKKKIVGFQEADDGDQTSDIVTDDDVSLTTPTNVDMEG